MRMGSVKLCALKTDAYRKRRLLLWLKMPQHTMYIKSKRLMMVCEGGNMFNIKTIPGTFVEGTTEILSVGLTLPVIWIHRVQSSESKTLFTCERLKHWGKQVLLETRPKVFSLVLHTTIFSAAIVHVFKRRLSGSLLYICKTWLLFLSLSL